MSNPLVHGWNGDFHNSMFKKRFPSAATPALSSLAPTVGGVTAAGGGGGRGGTQALDQTQLPLAMGL